MISVNSFILIIFLLASSVFRAQNEEFSHSSSWNSVAVKANLNEKLFLKNEFNFRRTNFIQDWQQIVLRPSLQYKLNKRFTLAFGYSYIDNYIYANSSSQLAFKENNLWQQVFLKQNFKFLSIAHRIRFEERFKESASLTDDNLWVTNIGYSGRLRYRLIISLPILEDKLSILTYDEVFLDFKKKWLPQKCTQNRLYLGFRFRKSNHITIKSGYNHINIIKPNSVITNHIWETTLIYSI